MVRSLRRADVTAKGAGMSNRVTEPEARAAYLAMEGRRSVDRLHERFTETARETPSLRTFKAWCAKHKWRDIAAEHDEHVASEAGAEIAKDGAKKTVTRAMQFDTLATDILQKAIDGLVHVDTTKLRPSEIRALAEVSERAAKMFKLLEGRATDRTDNITREKMVELIEEMTKELDDRLAIVPTVH